jgi:hypothetical protein
MGRWPQFGHGSDLLSADSRKKDRSLLKAPSDRSRGGEMDKGLPSPFFIERGYGVTERPKSGLAQGRSFLFSRQANQRGNGTVKAFLARLKEAGLVGDPLRGDEVR